MPEGIEAIFLFRMLNVISNRQRTVEEYLLALRWRDAMLLPVLFSIVRIPLEASAFLKKGINIHLWLSI